MATGGKRPKSGALRLIDGTHRNDRHGNPEDVGVYSGEPLPCPDELKGKVRDAWERWIPQAVWLDEHRIPTAIAFCHLWVEFMSDPKKFQSNRHGQMRAYLAELGLSDERNRKVQQDAQKDPSKKYFD